MREKEGHGWELGNRVRILIATYGHHGKLYASYSKSKTEWLCGPVPPLLGVNSQKLKLELEETSALQVME